MCSAVFCQVNKKQHLYFWIRRQTNNKLCLEQSFYHNVRLSKNKTDNEQLLKNKQVDLWFSEEIYEPRWIRSFHIIWFTLKYSAGLSRKVQVWSAKRLKLFHSHNRIKHCRSHCAVYTAVKWFLCFSSSLSHGRKEKNKLHFIFASLSPLPLLHPLLASRGITFSCMWERKKTVLKSLMSEKDVTSLKKRP